VNDPGDEHKDIAERLAIRWEAMGDMANHERAEARDEILRLRKELELCRRVLPIRISRLLYEGEG
jgi:hypothetical protein